MSLVQFLFSFQGRVRRLHLWLFVIVLSLVDGGLVWHFGHWGLRDDIQHVMGPGGYIMQSPGSGLIGLLAFWMNLAVFAKRWHDRDKSAWMLLINLIPLVGWIWTLIECGFMDGTQGSNKYGPSPKGL